MSIKFSGSLLKASVEDRTLTYKLLPFGEAGRTNVGKVTASKGVIDIPEVVDSLSANLEHDRTKPAAKFVNVTQEDDGLYATYRVLSTTTGNDLLIEATEGVRTGVSVEIDNPVIRNGELKSGTLSGSGFVTNPAFPSAQLVASDVGEIADEEKPEDSNTEVTEEDSVDTPEEEKEMADAPVTESLTASAPAGIPTGNSLAVKSPDDFYKMLATGHQIGNGRMLAALDEVIQADGAATQSENWIGEIWKRRTHRQRFLPLFNKQPLTGMKMTGWEFDVRVDTNLAVPEVDTYAGFPAEPHSAEVITKAVDINALREAGASAIDRAFVDFASPDFWSALYREYADDLSRKLDLRGRTHLLTPANYTALAEPLVSNTAPDEKAALSLIVTGVAAVQDLATPDFAVIAPALYRQMILTSRQDAVEYLSMALGLDPQEGRLDQFKLVAGPASMNTNSVLVGCSEMHTFYGEKSARVETVNIGTGGVEFGLFGYYALHTKNPQAFSFVTASGA